MELGGTGVLPPRVRGLAEARDAVARTGTAVLGGIGSEQEAVAALREFLGETAVRVNTQFEATKAVNDELVEAATAQGVDERGRRRRVDADFYTTLAPHNDGFAFGDFAPDHIALWCDRPCATGGASFVVDHARLLEALAADDENADLAEFCWTVPIDHSEANFPQNMPGPIADRRAPGGRRLRARVHAGLSALPGRGEREHQSMIDRWRAAVYAANIGGPRLRLDTGDLLVVDNYRLSHGREAYEDLERRVVSIWSWSTAAVRVPSGPLSIVNPDIAALGG